MLLMLMLVSKRWLQDLFIMTYFLDDRGSYTVNGETADSAVVL